MLTFSQVAAVVIGAFYVFAGVVVLRAMALDRVMDQLLAALNEPSAPKERMKSRVLTVGAVLTLSSGVALMLLSPLAAPVFVANALWQGGYLLWAEKALPPEDDDEARGRKQTKNAFVVYLAATAFVLWLAAQGLLRPWEVPAQAHAIDAALILAAIAGAWLILNRPKGNRASNAAQDGVAEEAAEERPRWLVLRTDDAGNVFLVQDELDAAGADELVETLTAKGHKQTYTTHAYNDWEEHAAVIAQFNAQV